MDLTKVLEQLRRELVNLDAAIFSLEQFQANGSMGRRRLRVSGRLRDTGPKTLLPAGRVPARRVEAVP